MGRTSNTKHGFSREQVLSGRRPTHQPTCRPTPRPTCRPPLQPTLQPTLRPPTLQPTLRPTRRPTHRPTPRPTRRPTLQPTPQLVVPVRTTLNVRLGKNVRGDTSWQKNAGRRKKTVNGGVTTL